MKIKLVGSYRNKKGTLVFRYAVTGTEAQLKAYKEAQGENYRETDEGVPLWFSTRNVGQTGTLGISQNGRIFADMSEFDAAASLAAQYGGNLGQELAKVAAAKLMGNGFGSSSSVASTTPADKANLAE